MITQIVQTKTNFSMSWEVLCNGNKVAEAEAPFLPRMFLAEIRLPNDMRKLIYDPSDTTYGTSLMDRLAFRVFDKDHYIGSMVGKTQKVKRLFGSYPYYEYVDNGETFLVYETGFGMKGLYLCFYKDDKLVCIVEKELTTVNYKDKYTCYMINEAYLTIVTSFVIYYDVVSYGDFLEIAAYSKTKSVVNTYQKDLKDKFDPDFIPKIKALEKI